MGIIGVVAALTLPNLNSSTGDKEKVAKVKKIYSNLEDAIGRAQAVYGPINEWFKNSASASDNSKKYGERISEFMKISKNCDVNTGKGCFSSSKTFDGSETSNIDNLNRYYKLILADGTSLAFGDIGATDFNIFIDIDGPNKGSAVMGKDQFFFVYSTDENHFVRDPEEYFPAMVGDRFDECLSDGYYCSLWILDYENMDYLKLDSNRKCPDGKTILNGTTNITCR